MFSTKERTTLAGPNDPPTIVAESVSANRVRISRGKKMPTLRQPTPHLHMIAIYLVLEVKRNPCLPYKAEHIHIICRT